MSRTRTWPNTAVVFLAACVFNVAQPPQSLSAQQPTVERDELTQAILRYAFRYDGSNVRLLEGRIPDDLGPNFYAPPGTRLLGSVVMGSGVLVLAKSSTAPESLRAAYTRALGPRGWRPADTMQRRGFVDAAVDQPLILCRDGAQLHVQQSPRGAAQDDLFLHYRDGAGPCEQPRAAFRSMSDPAPFPTLYSPSGARGASTMRCYSQTGGRRGSMGTATMVAADMSAEDVLRHYGNQLESAGWRPASGGGRSLATGAWTRADSTGTAELKLQVREMAKSGPRCYDVQMTVSDGPR